MTNYFIWRGIDSRAFGVYVERPAPIIYPDKRETAFTIPGRAGRLTLPESDDSFDPYLQTQRLTVPGSRVAEVVAWLHGEGDVTFSTQPNRVQPARVVKTFTLDRASKHLDWYVGDVNFLCQPLKTALTPRVLMLTSGDTLVNGGDVSERPSFRVSGKGDFTLTAGGSTLSLDGLTESVIVDCLNQCIYTASGLYMGRVRGDYPALPVGASAITFTPGFAVSVVRMERYL